jgi:hypothetical protein
MYKFALAAGVVAFLAAPALAGDASGGGSFKVAEEGASIHIDTGDHDRDHHRIVVRHHDEDEHHHRVVIIHHDHDHDHDHDRDR